MLQPKNKKKELTLKEQYEVDKTHARKTFKSSPNSNSNARASKVVGEYKKGGQMKKLGCAKCGGMKKMATGGSTNNVNISKPGAGYAPRQVGGDNQKMNMYGIAQTGQGQMDGKTGVMKKGGMVKKPLAKAQMGKTVKTKPIPNDVYKRDSTNYSNAANKYLNPTTKKEYQEGVDSLKAIKSRYGTPNALEIKMKRTVSGSDLKKKGGVVKSKKK